ncbi:hypothetical protein [Streptomyces winkii]|uniref:hypothetical protein n=1 Tax=Streptomyces winkii TaxID=3051178 RepID=UPI0028D4E927|nr:hypothetical protein [Streptomyces sp. DSM 40971]
MNAFVAELGKRLADRWLSALVLPGLLFVAAVCCGAILGQAAALDAARLTGELTRFGDRLGSRPAAAVLTVAVGLLAATAAGLVVQGLAVGVRRAWVARRPHGLVARRRARAAAVRERDGHRYPERYLPARATEIGDRFRLVDERVDAQYGLSVALVWPRLWLLLPETVRPVIGDAHTRYQGSAETTAWGLLTVALGLMWWPALLVGGLTVLVGHRRGLASGAALADLVEAAVDNHQRQLAEALGVGLPHGRVTPAEGLQINDILNKRA